MHIKKWLVAVFALICCNSAFPQSSLLNSVESGMRTREPQWELERKGIVEIHDDPRTEFTNFFWRRGEETVDVGMVIYSSAEESGNRFDAFTKLPTIPGLLTMRILERDVGFGDGSFTWEEHRHAYARGICFRKGRFNIFIIAQSMNNARLFATHIMNILPAT